MNLDRTFPANSLLGQVLSLAHATFYDALPSNADHRPAVAPATMHPPKRANFVARSLTAIDDWFVRQHEKNREAYLAQAKDMVDLEHRMRELERQPYY